MDQPRDAGSTAGFARRETVVRRTPGAGKERDLAEDNVRDLQALLSSALKRLDESCQPRCAVAWALRDDGTPYVAASIYRGTPPSQPDAASFAGLANLPAATDLTEPHLDEEVQRLAERVTAQAAVSVRSSGGTPLALLLLTEPGRTTPRVLGELESAARSLEGPLAATLACGRLRSLDDRIRHLDRLARLGELTMEIAHEIRNPLVSLKTFFQLLPERGSEPEFRDQYGRVVHDELLRVERLLDDLIGYGGPRTAPAGTESADLRDALAAVFKLLHVRSRQSDTTLVVETDPSLPSVSIDPDRLRQIALNLGINAVDAAGPGGRVRITARAGKEGIELRFCDDGPGIPEEARERIFEPFFTTRRGRSGGLGLSIARRIAQDVGGRIELREAPEGGAEFCVQLPRG